MPPHGAIDPISKCPFKIDYRQEIQKLIRIGVKVYSVYCDTDIYNFMGKERKTKIENFYYQIAEETGGKKLSLEDTHLLITILLGICMKETDRLDEFIASLEHRKQFGLQEQKIIKALTS
jgi:hypothetical protein